MSHGDEGVIEGTDGQLVKEEDLLDLFSVPELRDKPKLFIFNHCR
jgi:hypothetical protein